MIPLVFSAWLPASDLMYYNPFGIIHQAQLYSSVSQHCLWAVYHVVFMSLVLQRLPSSPNGQKKHWEHQVLQQSGQTICILILLRFLQSCTANQNAKSKIREGNKSHQILSSDCLLLTKGSFTLTGLVWGCHTIPEVPVLQACFKDWSEAQIGNA